MKTATANRTPKSLRLAAYPNGETLSLFQEYCRKNNLGAAQALNKIIKSQLTIQDNSEASQMQQAIAMLERQVYQLEKIVNNL
jgi:hypothetical protein